MPSTVAAERIRAYFRREAARAELALEPRRYGAHYWDTEASGPEVHALELERVLILQQLNAELAERLPPGSGPGEALAPLFGEGRPGPRVDFLAPAAQTRIAELLAGSPELAADRAALLERVRPLLTEEDFVRFQDWNSPTSERLRRQLVGFQTSEAEFTALAAWPGFVNQGNGGFAEDAHAEAALADRIGVERTAELFRLRDPDVQTAVQDLHRLGLPVERAEWLAAQRGDAISRMQQVWADGGLAAEAKATRVEALRQAYAAQLAAALAPGVAMDAEALLP